MVKDIIVCSVSSSKTSEDVVNVVRRLCPEGYVNFKPTARKTRFDASKVVFCHCSLDGRLALTDVNDSIYDQAVKDACRSVGKANVAFIVTKVPVGDVSVRRRMIKQTQPTLTSNTGLLLVVDDVNFLDQYSANQLKEFIECDHHIENHVVRDGFKSWFQILLLQIINMMFTMAILYCLYNNPLIESNEIRQCHKNEELLRLQHNLLETIKHNITNIEHTLNSYNESNMKTISKITKLENLVGTHVNEIIKTINELNDAMTKMNNNIKISMDTYHQTTEDTKKQLISKMEEINSTFIEKHRSTDEHVLSLNATVNDTMIRFTKDVGSMKLTLVRIKDNVENINQCYSEEKSEENSKENPEENPEDVSGSWYYLSNWHFFKKEKTT